MAYFKTVYVKFADERHNYATSVNPKASDESLKEYFEGTVFDVGIYPVEKMRECIEIVIEEPKEIV